MKQIRKQKWILMVITLMMCIAVSGTKGNQTVSAATSGDFENEAEGEVSRYGDGEDEYGVGTIHTVEADECIVKIISTKRNDLQVEYMGVTKERGWITVPYSVEINGKTYYVTKLADGAFSGNKKAESADIEADITAIGKNTFKNCKKLRSITCISSKLKKIGPNAFYGSKKLWTIGFYMENKLTGKSIDKKALNGTKKNLEIEVLPLSKVSKFKKYFKGKGNNTVKVHEPQN